VTVIVKSERILSLNERTMGPVYVNPFHIVAVYAIENGNVSVLVMSTGFRFEIRMPLDEMRDAWFAALTGEEDNELPDPRNPSPAPMGRGAKNKAGTLPLFR
jgi:hypothetical protein